MKTSFSFISIFKKNSQAELTPIKDGKQFGAFTGVYMPTVLTILGIMMYLRLGWIVGNVGYLGTVLIIFLSFALTGCTALSMSSIVTNVRLGSGGIFTLVSQSLGLEIGGSIGVPLYLAQGISAPMYVYGFVEGWKFIYPNHSSLYVSIICFFLIFLISYIGTKLVFKIQIFILVIVFLAVNSILFGAISNFGTYQDIARDGISLWGNFEDGDFWKIFSIAFPSATGILVGSSMSGNLTSPRKSIPKGTLFAWGTALLVNLILATWYALVGAPNILRGNFNFSIENSLIPEITLIGVMASCFTASLSCMIASPRILQSMGSFKIIPFSSFFKVLKNNEPKNAIFFTALFSFCLLILFQDINLIAPLVTTFFVIIYFIVNFVLAVEQSLNLVSFRPELKLPKFIPIFGSLLALFTMFLISPIVGFISISFIIVIYFYISRKNLINPWETVQSGIFKAFAEWSARKISMDKQVVNKRLWKPSILVPVIIDNSKNNRLKNHSDNIHLWFNFLHSMCAPQGVIQFIYFSKNLDSHEPIIKKSESYFQKKNILVSSYVIKLTNFFSDLQSALNVMDNVFFKPNSMFFVADKSNLKQMAKINKITSENKIALLFFFPYKDSLLGKNQEIILWVRDQSPHWKLGLSLSNLDYGILMSYKLMLNWKAKIRFICVSKNKNNQEMAKVFLNEVVELARMSKLVEVEVVVGDFFKILEKEKASLHILGFNDEMTADKLTLVQKKANGSCLFVRDSGIGLESAIV